jgi:hypothetical protein
MSTLRSASYLALLGGLVVGTGCMVEGDDVGDDEQTGVVDQEVGAGCSPWVCGSNDPYLSIYFHELPDLIGMSNPEGFTLLGMVVGPQMYNLDVVNGELRGWKAGFAPVTGAALANKVIKVKGPDGKVYNLKIVGAPSTTPLYPVGSGTTPAYQIEYTIQGDPDQRARNICDNPGQYLGEYDTLFQNKWTVVLFETERFDAKSKRITGNNHKFFNIGCAGHILSKMHLTHHSIVTGVGAYATTPEERQTMMKMYAADYCKDGTSFTIGGEDLSWTDDHGWLPHYYPLASLSLEARWNKDGPICVESPRLKGSMDPLATTLFPAGVEAAIAARCPAAVPPTCSSLGQSLDPGKLEGAHLVSANP